MNKKANVERKYIVLENIPMRVGEPTSKNTHYMLPLVIPEELRKLGWEKVGEKEGEPIYSHNHWEAREWDIIERDGSHWRLGKPELGSYWWCNITITMDGKENVIRLIATPVSYLFPQENNKEMKMLDMEELFKGEK